MHPTCCGRSSNVVVELELRGCGLRRGAGIICIGRVDDAFNDISHGGGNIIQYCRIIWGTAAWTFVSFDFILYVPSTIFQLNRDGSSWVEPVLG